MDVKSLSRNRLIVIAVVGALVIAGLALVRPGGGGGEAELPFTLSWENVREPPSGPVMVSFDSSDYNQTAASVCMVPVVAGEGDSDAYYPLLFNPGVEVPATVSKYQGMVEVSMQEFEGCTSEMSSAIADRYWTQIKVAVVVEDYEHALLAAPLASYINAPILFDCDDIRAYLDGRGIDSIIKVGDCGRYGGLHVLELKTQEDVWEYYISVLGDGDSCNYLVVANPGDIDYSDERLFIPGLSLAAGALASERHALVITGDYTVDKNWTFQLGYGTAEAGAGERGEDPDVVSEELEVELQLNISKRAVQIDNDIDRAVECLSSNAKPPEYLAIVGGPAAVPMMYLKSPIYYENVQQDEKGEEYLATDSFYGDLDIKLNWTQDALEENYGYIEDEMYTQELYVGRIVAPNVLDASALVARSVGYWEYEFDGATDPTSWSVRGEIVNSLMCGDSDIFAGTHQQSVFAQNGMIAEMEHPTEFRRIIYFDEQGAVQKMQTKNGIIYDGHGYPDGWYWLWASTHDNEEDFDRIGSEDVWGLDLRASPVFGACCLSSAMDWPLVWATSENRQEMTPDICMSLSFLHAGAICYIGATEESWGAFFGGLADGTIDQWGYGDFDMPTLFWMRVFEGNSMGKALTLAKEDFYQLLWSDGSGRPFARLCILETVLYGDPAAEIYHEGIA